MNNLQISACTLSVLLAAVAGQAPCAAGVLFEKELLSSNSLNQLDVFGLTYSAAGNAQLSMSPTGTLVISNIGSSGLDGVTVPIGDVRGMSMSMDLGDMGALAPGGLVEVFYPYQFGETRVYVAESSGGSGVLGLACTGGPGVCTEVTILNDGVVVDSADFGGVPSEGFDLVTGDMGSDPATGESMSFSVEQVGENYVYTISLPVGSQLSIAGRGPVYGATIQIARRGLPPAQTLSGPVRVMATDMIPIEIVSMNLTLPYWQPDVYGDDPFSYRRSGRVGVRSTGPTQKILGLDEPLACQSHPKMWLFAHDVRTPARVVSVSNIGSSGLDGVAIDFATGTGCGPGFFECADGNCVADPANCIDIVIDRVLHFGGKDAVAPDYLDLDSDGDTLRLGAVGTIGGGTGSGLGSIRLAHEPGTIGEIALYTDFAPLGATLVRVEVYQDGAFVGEFEEFEREDTILASISHPPTGIDLTGCGKLGGDILGPPCFFFTTQNPVTVSGPGLVLVGNEVRILAVDVATPVEFIKELHLTGTNLEDFDFRTDLMQDTGLYETAMGVQHRVEGTAQLSTNSDGHLVVSNIGSSGLDGVSIDLGEATGGSVRLADGGPFNVDSFFDVFLRSFDPDDDNLCMLGVRMEAQTEIEVLVSGSHSDPTMPLEVTLRTGDETITGSFSMTQAEFVTVTDPAGLGIALAEIDARGSVNPEGGYVECMTTHLISDPGGAGGGGRVTVVSPAGVSYPEVASIEICATTPPTGNATRVQTRLLRCRASQSFTIGQVQLDAFGVPGSTLGAARFWWSAKKNGASVGQAANGIDDDCDGLTVANIGSSGEDGVSFDLSDELCNYLDDDCDGDSERDWNDLVLRFNTTSSPGGPVKHGFVRLETTKNPGEIGQGGGGAVVYLDKSIISGPDGDEIGVSMEDEQAIPVEYLVRVEVYDAAGVLLAVEDENSHPPVLGSHPNILSFFGNAHNGKHKKKVKITKPVDAATPLLSSGNTGGDLPGPLPATLTRSGQFVDNATGYEITLFPTGDVPFYGVAAVDLRFTADVGSTGSVNIKGITFEFPPPPCPADLNNDGFLDSGDITGFVDGFLAGDPVVDFNNDGFFDSGDISAFVEAFLAGC